MCFATVFGVMKSRSAQLRRGQAGRERTDERRRASHKPSHAREEVIHPDGLGQVIVGAEQQTRDSVRFVGARRRDEDDRQLLAVLLPKLARDLVTGRPGQVSLHDHEPGRLRCGDQKCIFAGARLLGEIAGARQRLSKRGARLRISVDHQHPARAIHGAPSIRPGAPRPEQGRL